MTYYLNIENTGLDNDDQARCMAELMQADGHDVEFTELFGLINPVLKAEDIGVRDQAWMAYVEAADGMVPAAA